VRWFSAPSKTLAAIYLSGTKNNALQLQTPFDWDVAQRTARQNRQHYKLFGGTPQHWIEVADRTNSSEST